MCRFGIRKSTLLFLCLWVLILTNQKLQSSVVCHLNCFATSVELNASIFFCENGLGAYILFRNAFSLDHRLGASLHQSFVVLKLLKLKLYRSLASFE